MEFISDSNLEISKDTGIKTFHLSIIGDVIFGFSIWILLLSLYLIIIHRKDDQFLYRSPNLLIWGLISAIICQLMTGLSLSLDSPNFAATWIVGHVCQYLFYPFFFLWYLTRSLRLVILFSRAKRGLYFAESDMSNKDNDRTNAILGQTENYSSQSLNVSHVRRPTHENYFVRVYYWFLFRFETEKEYFILTVLFTLVPVTLAVVFLSKANFRQLPVVNYSHWLKYEKERIVFSSVLLDIILRFLDWYLIATVSILLMPICKEFKYVY